MKDTAQRVKELREKGFSYKQITQELQITKGTISYHLNDKINREQKERRKRPERKVNKKVNTFKKGSRREKKKISDLVNNYKTRDVLEKIGSNPRCYLTGKTIDLSNIGSWSFDHVIPSSKGGSNELSNLGLATRQANMAKSDMLVEEFIQLCKEVLENFGYQITKL